MRNRLLPRGSSGAENRCKSIEVFENVAQFNFECVLFIFSRNAINWKEIEIDCKEIFKQKIARGSPLEYFECSEPFEHLPAIEFALSTISSHFLAQVLCFCLQITIMALWGLQSVHSQMAAIVKKNPTLNSLFAAQYRLVRTSQSHHCQHQPSPANHPAISSTLVDFIPESHHSISLNCSTSHLKSALRSHRPESQTCQVSIPSPQFASLNSLFF